MSFPTSVFAVEMVLGVSAQNVQAFLDRANSEEGVTLDKEFDRQFILSILISSGCLDYVRRMGLKRGDPLYDAILEALSRLSAAFTFGESPWAVEMLDKYFKSGVIPVSEETLFGGSDDPNNLVEIPKSSFDKIMELVKAILSEAMLEPAYLRVLDSLRCYDVARRILAGSSKQAPQQSFQKQSFQGSGQADEDGEIDFDL